MIKKSYRIDEAAREFDVSPRTVERLIQRGELDSYKIGGNRRILAEELDRVKKKEQSSRSG